LPLAVPCPQSHLTLVPLDMPDIVVSSALFGVKG
jgi:hypothetical protein